ncbi:MAG: hypothetical protein QOH31_3035, partial [Verrucomicrobiota bacterium]
MKNTIQLITALCLLALSAHAEIDEDRVARMKTLDGATAYIEQFLTEASPTETLIQNSAFIERTNQNDERFLLAKVLTRSPT